MDKRTILGCLSMTLLRRQQAFAGHEPCAALPFSGDHLLLRRANRQLAGRAERSAERTFEILAPRQPARALARRRPVRGDNRAEVHLLEAPQDGFCKRFRCLDRRVVADARKVIEFKVCKELVEAVRPMLRKDWVAFLP
jgi:hypothetical protein